MEFGSGGRTSAWAVRKRGFAKYPSKLTAEETNPIRNTDRANLVVTRHFCRCIARYPPNDSAQNSLCGAAVIRSAMGSRRRTRMPAHWVCAMGHGAWSSERNNKNKNKSMKWRRVSVCVMCDGGEATAAAQPPSLLSGSGVAVSSGFRLRSFPHSPSALLQPEFCPLTPEPMATAVHPA